MTDREIMEQALDALDYEAERGYDDGYRQLRDALRDRLAQPEQCQYPQCHCPTDNPCLKGMARPKQEPVAHTLNCVCGAVWDVSPDGVEEMVHAPNPPQRKPLTEKRIEELYSFWVVDCQDIVGFARAVERTVKGEA